MSRLKKYLDLLKEIEDKAITEEIKAFSHKAPRRLYAINDVIVPAIKDKSEIKTQRQASSSVLLEGLRLAMISFKDTKKEYTLLHDVLVELDRILRLLFPTNANTLNNAVRPFRGLLRQILPNGSDNDFYKDSFDFFGLNRSERLDRRIEYQKVVRNRNEKRGKLEPLYIEDIIVFMKNLQAIPLIKKNLLDKIILLLLSSGVRFIELIQKSSFEKVQSPNMIKVVNIAKSKKNGDDSIRNLLVLDADEFMKIYEFIKENLKSINNMSLLGKLNRRFKILFSNIADETYNEGCYITLRYTRVIYANMNYKLFAEPNNIPYESYIQEQLKHRDPISTKSYLCINLKSKVDRIKKSKKIKGGNILVVTEKLANIVKDLKELDDQRIHWRITDVKKYYKLNTPEMKIVMELYNKG